MFRNVTLLGLVCMGCVTKSGVVPMGQDTYMISRQGWIATQSVSGLKANAFTEADAYCSQMSKSLQPISTREIPGVLGRSYPDAEIEFQCLSATDKELSRPKLMKAPDVVIENR